jgi:hypothetical protein
MTQRDQRLLEVLKAHTIKNAYEIAHQLWKDGDEDGIREPLLEAIERCEAGNGTEEDWDLLVEQTEM